VLLRARVTACVLSLIVLFPMAAAAQDPAPPPPPPASLAVATVGAEAITVDDWLSTLKVFDGAEALRKLIQERLVIQEAHRLKIAFKDAEVDAQITRIKAQYPNDRAFEEMLHQRGIPLSALRREVKTDLLLDRIVDTLGKVTDEAVQGYYDNHLSQFTKPTRVELYVITTRDLRTAAQAYERLATEDFTTVAQDLSIDEHAAEGGFWGLLSAEEVEPEVLRTAAFALEPGKHSEPIESGDKAYVVWVKSKEPGSEVTETEAASQIREKLRAQNGVSRASVLRGITRRAKIVIKQPEYAYLQAEYEKAKELQVVVDGETLDLRTPPFMVPQTDRLVVPADPLVKAVGGQATWYPTTDTLQIIRGDTQLLEMTGSPIAIVKKGDKEEQVTIDQPPIMREGVLFVSPRWIVEQLGGSIMFSADDYSLKIKSVKEPAPTEP
jgi:parvulin-like peptidyl-prolyl isomerase